MKLIRQFLRWTRWPGAFLSEFLWYRKLHGGHWAQTMVDFPVVSVCWCDISDKAFAEYGEEYREGLWRGTPIWEYHP